MGLKQRLIRVLWLTHAGVREEYGSYNWHMGRTSCGRGLCDLQQPEARHVLSRGSSPWNTGPWQWWAAQAPLWGGRRVVLVDIDLCFHTGFLVAAEATLVFHARLWGLS